MEATNIMPRGSLSGARNQAPDRLVEGLIGTERVGSELILVGSMEGQLGLDD